MSAVLPVPKVSEQAPLAAFI